MSEFNSRHQIEHDKYDVWVGWDSSLDTFFATVEDLELDEEDGAILVWIGTVPGEYRDIQTFKTAFTVQLEANGIADATITDELAQQLQADYDKSPPGAGTMRKTQAMQSFLNDWHQQQS
ncbi:MAG: hypothetical protein AAFY17_15575 [Cyanobacteria bacterium J06642_11]